MEGYSKQELCAFGGCGGVGDSSRLSVAWYVSVFRPVNNTSLCQLTVTLQDPLEEVVCRGSLRQRELLSSSIEESRNES